MISVCIATFNGQDYIQEQLESILTQLDQSDEIIISDDGSVDATINICEKINDNRIKIFHNVNQVDTAKKINKVTRNFENAIKHSRGDIIFLCDQDDVWASSKISKCKEIFKSQNCLMILHDAYVVDENKDIVKNSYFEIINAKKGLVKNIRKNSYLGCCMCFRKELLNIALPFPISLHAHDIWLGLLAEYFGNTILSTEKLIYYRRHSNNVTTSGKESKNSFIYKISYRINFLRLFLTRLVNVRFNVIIKSLFNAKS
ncbi:MAG: hypothetical protein RLY43_624 [Bacteroidota bacterium]|jgi:glycosyltransferase involved in cell wall biosynthesis